MVFIYKPEWVGHYSDKQRKGAIYSIHIHPDGSRLATGGFDAKVKIWSMEPFLDSSKENDSAVNKLLSTLSVHNGAILCVRWSNISGRYLASSSDTDNVVIIWERDLDRGPTTTFGSEEVNIESYKPIKYLRGHASDVQDLAWSHDNQYLTSCGVDGNVFVWDGKSFDRLKKIDQHSAFVKGVTWDPVGKYMASQSDDKTVKVWRTADWGLEKEIKEPFAQAPGSTFFQRLSWSPEGSHIASPSAMNGGSVTAAIISRDLWVSDISLVGHEFAVEVAKFNPCMFYFHEGPIASSAVAANASTGERASVVALGSQDRSVSIWVTSYSRPLFVANELFKNNVYDLAWTPDGQGLIACSQDGSVAWIQFENELGTPCPTEEIEEGMSKYGFNRKGAIIAETPDQLALEEEHAVAVKTSALKRIAELMGDEIPHVSDTASSLTNPSTSNKLNAQQSHPSTPSVSSMDTDTTQVLQTPSSSTQLVSSSNNSSSLPQQQTITIGKDGKKRIQPQFVRGLSGSNIVAMTNTSSSILNSSSSSAGNPPSRIEIYEMDDPSRIMPNGIGTAVIGNKRKEQVNGTSETNPPKRIGTVGLSGIGSPEWSRSAIVPPWAERSQVRLGIPKVKLHFVRKLGGGSTISLECHNSKEREPSKLVCSSQGNTIWMDFLPSAILLLAGSHQFSAVGCEDGTIYTYSPAGRHLFPPIVLEATPSFLELHGHYMMCLTSVGLLYIWDLCRQFSVLSAVSVAPILQVSTSYSDALNSTTSIDTATVHENGVPVIKTSKGEVFVYHLQMKVWTRIADMWLSASEFYGSGEKGPLAYWERSVLMSGSSAGKNAGSFAKGLLKGDPKAQRILTMDHVENNLISAEIFNSSDEYKHWLRCYARRLSDEGAHTRAKELCQELLGPVHSPIASKMEWSPTIMGISKRGLLMEILPLLGQNRALQRIVSEYHAALSKISS